MKKKRRILLALLGVLMGWGGAGMAQAAPTVTFDASDEPGSWYKCVPGVTTSKTELGCVPQADSLGTVGQKSLAIITTGESVGFTSTGNTNTIHTAVSLMYPHNAHGLPFDTDLDIPSRSHGSVVEKTLIDPGLYVFFCDIHVYMFAAVIVVPENHKFSDGSLLPLDLGKSFDLPNVTTHGIGIVGGLAPDGLPSASNLALRLMRTFFIYTNPLNWQYFATADTTWDPVYPKVPVMVSADGITSVNAGTIDSVFHNPTTLNHPVPPTHPGVGQVWVDTQFEKMTGKVKPGTATAVNATTFKVERKVGLPGIHHHQGLNNPHNMWTDKNQTVIYQTQWFDEKLEVFDRKTGVYIRTLEVGPAPAHVMTRTSNDYVHVSANGDNYVREFRSLANINPNHFERDIQMQTGECCAHPHGHFMSADGQMMVTPNEDADATALYDFTYGLANPADTGHSPIATGMMPDSSKYYVANFLDSTLSVIGIRQHHGHAPTIKKLYDINLLGSYDPISGKCGPAPGVDCTPANGHMIGALPIQTPVSPDGRFVILANALTSSILVIDTKTDKVVASLPCDAGCHGVQFGAKKDGGYYAYVASKFSNRMLVVDPNHGSDAAIVGSVLLTTANTSSHFGMDGHISNTDKEAYAGMGGQGVLPIPLVYNGWVQNLPEEWKEKLTHQQRHPIGEDPR